MFQYNLIVVLCNGLTAAPKNSPECTMSDSSDLKETQLEVSREAVIRLLNHFHELRESNKDFGQGYESWGRGFHDGQIDALRRVLEMENE